MQSLGRTLAVLLLMTALANLVVSGCASPGAGPDLSEPPEGYFEPTSAENVIANLQLAYLNMDLEHYMSCFADTFTFYPWPPAAADTSLGIPSSWGRADEEALHAFMFSEESGFQVMSLSLATAYTQTIEGDDDQSIEDDTFLRREHVLMWVRTNENGNRWVTAPSEFWLRARPVGARDAFHVWEIYEWRDNPYEEDSRVGRENPTWSEIKAIYWRALR